MLNPISKTRTTLNDAYRITREWTFLNQRRKCATVDPSECHGKAVEVDHIHGRTGTLLVMPSNLQALCRPCHQLVTAAGKGADYRTEVQVEESRRFERAILAHLPPIAGRMKHSPDTIVEAVRAAYRDMGHR